MNEYLLNNNYISFGDLDSNELKGMKDALTANRLFGANACHINPDKKYAHIYIEDGFNDEDADYDGIIIIDNKAVCAVTTNPNKLKIDSLSYTKIMDKHNLYAKIVSMEDFKKKYINEYFRYELVIQNKVRDLKKCLEIDEYTPKPRIYARSYNFTNKKVNIYGIVRINYNDIKDGIEGLPNFNEEKKKEFMDCINNLGIIVK